jgi:hypothetical protein
VGYCDSPALNALTTDVLDDYVPTAARTEDACGVCSDTNLPTQTACEAASPVAGTWTGYTWNALTYTTYTTADGPDTDITANGVLCATAATSVYVARCAQPGATCTSATPDAATVEGFYTVPYTPAEWTALQAWAVTAPTEEDVKQCYIEINTARPCTDNCVNPYFPQKSFRDCADTCAEAEAKQQAETAVDAIDDATLLFVDLRVVFDEQAKPKLQCKFVSDIVYDIFYPLCQEAYGGIFLITLANYIALVGLIISLPLGIMATKRFVPTSSGETEDNMVGAKHQM